MRGASKRVQKGRTRDRCWELAATAAGRHGLKHLDLDEVDIAVWCFFAALDFSVRALDDPALRGGDLYDVLRDAIDDVRGWKDRIRALLKHYGHVGLENENREARDRCPCESCALGDVEASRQIDFVPETSQR